MRLFLAAVLVVATFAFVVLLISRLFPYGAGWAGLCLAITCLYASAFAAWAVLGKESGGSTGKGTQRHTVRDNLLYYSVGMVVVTIAVAVLIHDDRRGIVRTFKNDWFVGLGSASVALGYAAKAFWTFRRNWRVWVTIAGLFALFTAITIPMLSQMAKVPLLLMGPLGNVEFLIAFAALHWIVGRHAHRNGVLTP